MGNESIDLKKKQTASYIEMPNRNHSSLIGKILEKDDQLSKTIIEFVRRNQKIKP